MVNWRQIGLRPYEGFKQEGGVSAIVLFPLMTEVLRRWLSNIACDLLLVSDTRTLALNFIFY
jgi:hypothetical protein